MIFRWYIRSLNKHPWKTQIISSGTLGGVADLIAQFGVERRSIKQYDGKRTARFFGFGAVLFAPALRTWFAFLNRHVHWRAMPKLSPLLRMVIDQTCFGPCLVTTFLIGLRLSEGNDFQLAVSRWKKDFPDIYLTGLKIWPATQVFNFYFVPLQYQMIVVQTVALIWNSYLAWRTHQHSDLTGMLVE